MSPRGPDRQIVREGTALHRFSKQIVLEGLPLMPAPQAKNGREPVQNAGEKRIGLIPVAGPMVLWFTARARLDAQVCFHCYVNSGLHDILALRARSLRRGHRRSAPAS